MRPNWFQPGRPRSFQRWWASSTVDHRFRGLPSATWCWPLSSVRVISVQESSGVAIRVAVGGCGRGTGDVAGGCGAAVGDAGPSWKEARNHAIGEFHGFWVQWAGLVTGVVVVALGAGDGWAGAGLVAQATVCVAMLDGWGSPAGAGRTRSPCPHHGAVTTQQHSQPNQDDSGAGSMRDDVLRRCDHAAGRKRSANGGWRFAACARRGYPPIGRSALGVLWGRGALEAVTVGGDRPDAGVEVSWLSRGRRVWLGMRRWLGIWRGLVGRRRTWVTI